MEQEQALQLLASVEVLSGLSRADLELLLDLGSEVEFAADQELVSEGRTAPPFAVVLDGSLRVVLPRQRPGSAVQRASEVELNTLRRGDCFGEYSMLDDMPASASVVGITPGVVLQVPQDHVKSFLASDDRIGRTVYRNMLRILVGRFKQLEGRSDRDQLTVLR